MPEGTNLLVLIGAPVALLLVIGVAWWVNRTPAGYRDDGTSDLPLYSVALPEGVTEAPAPTGATAPAARAPVVPHLDPWADDAPEGAPPLPTGAGAASAGVARRPPVREFTTARGAAAGPASGERAEVPPPGARGPAIGERPITALGVPGREVEGHLVKFSVPQDGTLQFLPGRLQILDGQDAGREVRFVHVPGPEGMTVTFGRSEGPAYRHVQLREATVSRTHARLVLDGGAWRLTNLSETNPVVINGRLMAPGEETPVADGDRIEMGEVVFGFRSK
jgi:hypothetical protein